MPNPQADDVADLVNTFRCYFCGKVRRDSQLKPRTVLTTQTVRVCNDKYINDCN